MSSPVISQAMIDAHTRQVGIDVFNRELREVSSSYQPEGGHMTATQVGPRVIAEALLMGTDDLARVLTKWAAESMPTPEYDRAWEPTPLDDFDDRVERARNYLVAAHEAQKAWNEDNPPEEIKEA